MPGRKRATRGQEHRAVLDAQRHRYEELLAMQGGHCALCPAVPKPTRKLDMDHDHKTMRVRGLLCVRCNRAIPTWLTAEWAEKVAAYLRNPPFDQLPEE